MRPCSGRTAPTLGPSRGEQALRLQSGIRAKGRTVGGPFGRHIRNLRNSLGARTGRLERPAKWRTLVRQGARSKARRKSKKKRSGPKPVFQITLWWAAGPLRRLPTGSTHVGSKADVAGQWPAPPKHVDAQPQINRLRFRKLKSMKRNFRGLSRPTGPPHGAQNNHRAADSASEGTTNHSWYTIAT